MKIKKYISLGVYAISLFMASCTSEFADHSSGGFVVNCMVQDFIDESETRTLIGVSPSDVLSYSWAVGDVLGIFPDQGTQVPFELSAGSISQDGLSAKFNGGPWGLKTDHQYYSYFPFTYDCFDQNVDKTKVPVSYLGQKQVGFDDTTNAGQYDFNAAGASSVENGTVSFAFKRLGAMLRLKFALPQTATYKTLTLTANANVIPVTGKVDLTAQNIVYTPLTYSNTLSMDLNNVQGTVGQTAYVYMMIPPMKLKTNGNTLTATLVYNDGSDKSTTYNICTVGTSTINVPDILADYRYKREAVYLSGDPVGSMSGGHDEPEDHEYVDLGLSVKWATCNVGANAPEEYGDYFAWGEVEPYYLPGHSQDSPCSNWIPGKTGYNWASYKWCNGSSSTMTKYCTSSSYGTVDNKTTLDLEDDVAHVNWGGDWRMPTKAEQDELLNNCTWTWTTQSGVEGYKVVGLNGKSIFLPSAGYRSDSDLNRAGAYGYYWSSSLYLYEYYSFIASGLGFNSGDVDWYADYRYIGRSVRAVCP